MRQHMQCNFQCLPINAATASYWYKIKLKVQQLEKIAFIKRAIGNKFIFAGLQACTILFNMQTTLVSNRARSSSSILICIMYYHAHVNLVVALCVITGCIVHDQQIIVHLFITEVLHGTETRKSASKLSKNTARYAVPEMQLIQWRCMHAKLASYTVHSYMKISPLLYFEARVKFNINYRGVGKYLLLCWPAVNTTPGIQQFWHWSCHPRGQCSN